MSRQYHHGDLRNALLNGAEEMIETAGIDSLSLRKLADNVGVSRTALYHHFSDKSALLCAITQRQFERWNDFQRQQYDEGAPTTEQIRIVVQNYLEQATRRPMFYDLMFGAVVWQHGTPDEALRSTAYEAFSDFVKFIERWQQDGVITTELPASQLSRVIWGMMHGLARLLIDGIYVDRKQIDEMSRTVATLLSLNATQ